MLNTFYFPQSSHVNNINSTYIQQGFNIIINMKNRYVEKKHQILMKSIVIIMCKIGKYFFVFVEKCISILFFNGFFVDKPVDKWKKIKFLIIFLKCDIIFRIF